MAAPFWRHIKDRCNVGESSDSRFRDCLSFQPNSFTQASVFAAQNRSQSAQRFARDWAAHSWRKSEGVAQCHQARFFAGTARWTPEQHRDFQETHEALRGELKPLGRLEEYLIAEMALACTKTAMVLRYEGIAALKFHRRREDQLNAQIAAADPAERTRLEHQRDHLKCAGLWGPTIPGERDARAITRYGGSLDAGFIARWRILRR